MSTGLPQMSAPAEDYPARTEWLINPFAEAAIELQERGLAVIPLGGDDGKAALKRRYPKWRRRPGRPTVASWADEHCSANIGVLCALSRIVVVDIDDAALLQPMLKRFGDTPLIIATRRGFQLWYRARGGEQPANLRTRDGLEVEIKAGPAAIVVVPPSWNRETGHPYCFERGGWSDLKRLPPFEDAQAADNTETTLQSLRPNPIGRRNTSLFNHLRGNFYFKSLAEVEAEALWYNDVHQVQPEPTSKVLATAGSVWAYMTARGRCAAGDGGPYIRLTHAELDALKTTGDLYPQALALQVELKRQHGARAARGELFAISAHRMSEERLIPGLTSRKRIEQVRRAAEEINILRKIREADRALGQFQAALYTFGRLVVVNEDVVPLAKGKKL